MTEAARRLSWDEVQTLSDKPARRFSFEDVQGLARGRRFSFEEAKSLSFTPRGPDAPEADYVPIPAPVTYSESRDKAGTVETLGRGIAQRGAHLAGGFTRFVGETADELADWLEKRVPLGQVKIDGQGIHWRASSEKDVAEEGPLMPLARQLEETDIYEPMTTWEDVKSAPLSEFIPFALEQGIVSSPDMAAVLVNLPGYIAARTGEMAQERAEADQRAEATVEDFLKVAPASVATGLMERLGTRGILGLDDAVSTIADVPKAVLKGSAKEAATEAVEEATEYTATRLGTETGFEASEAGESALAGAVAGGVYGGAVRAGTASAQAALPPRRYSFEEAKALASEQAEVPETTPEPAPEGTGEGASPETTEPPETSGTVAPTAPGKRKPRRVPRSQAELERLLDDWDRLRNAPDPDPETKRRSQVLQSEALAELGRLEVEASESWHGKTLETAQAQAAQYQPLGAKKTHRKERQDYERGFREAALDEVAEAPQYTSLGYKHGLRDGQEYRRNNPPAEDGRREVDFELLTASGQKTRYTLPNDPRAIANLRKRLEGRENRSKFYSRQPMVPGANYVGFRAEAEEQARPVSRKEPLRREAILADLMKSLGAPLYQGRVKGKNTLGFYRPRLEEVRVKKPADIETTAHEIAHLLDDRIPEIRKQWTPARNDNKAVRDELREISYDRNKLYEGFAEFVRLWATQKDQAQEKAPNFYRWFEGFVARSPHGPALRKTQDQMHAWFDQSALDRARSKIGEPPAINAFLEAPGDLIRQKVFDDLHGILRMERDITGRLNPAGAYETSRLTRAAASIAEGAMTLGAPKVRPDGSHTFEGKGLRQILDPVAENLDDFLLYAVGRSARELKLQGREKLFTDAEIRAMAGLERPEFRRAFGEYQRWNNAVLDFAQAKGLINPNLRRLWKRTQYLPFHRVGNPKGAFSPVQGDWRGIKALTGGSENLRDVLGNMIDNAASLIHASLINEARVKVAQLAAQKGGAKFMAKIPKESRAVKIHVAEVERAMLDALGVSRREHLTPEQQEFLDEVIDGMAPVASFMLHNQPPGGPNVVAVMRNGRPVYYEVADPILYRALTALKRPAKHWLVKALSVPRRIGQATITLTPDFMAANFARDTLMGSVMSRHGFRPLVDSAKGLMSRLKEDETYKEFIANGGGFASYLLDEGAFRTNLERFYTRQGIDYRAVMDSPAKLLYGLERMADAVEMSTRLGEFRRAIERGEHPRHAAYSAREVSTDFGMRGDSRTMSFLYDTVIFLKAGMNSLDRLYRGFAHDPNRAAIAAKTGLIALLSAGLYAVNRDNPLYQELEDWDRDTHWHFFIPTPEALHAWDEGRDVAPEDAYTHLRYPKIWEIGAIGSIAERQLEGILEGQPVKAQEKVLRLIGDLFNFEYIPAAVEPLYEVAINRERFTDRPIETQGMESLEPWARAGTFTSETLKQAGEMTRDLPRGLQLNPAVAEHLLRGYFNTWAMYGLDLADAALFDDTRPDARPDTLPVVRRFYSAHPARHTKAVTELYDALEAAREVRRTMRTMDRRMRPDIASELEQRAENRLYDQLSRAERHLQVIRREMDQVMRARDLATVRELVRERSRIGNGALLRRAQSGDTWHDAGALKRILLDDLIRERNQFAKMVMDDVKTRQEPN